MIKVLKEFYDLKEGVLRQVGERFEATEERFAELKEQFTWLCRVGKVVQKS